MTILNRVQDHYNESLQYFKEDSIVVCALQGSQNYKLDLPSSDVDTKLIIMPSFKEISLNKKPHSITHIRENEEHIDFKDIRLYFETFKKGNPNFVEVLFTPYVITNPIFSSFWNELTFKREEIARLNPYRAVQAMKGVALEKLHAMEHPYPSKIKILEKYGYDCYHPETLFLTKRGWLYYDDVLDTDELGTVNPITLELEWQYPIGRIKKRPTSQMYEGETYNTHFCITETHNVFTSKIKNINLNGNKYNTELANWKLEPLKECLKSNRHRHILSFPKNNNKDNINFSDDILKLFGAFIAEGTIQFRDKEHTIPKAVRITQTKNGKTEFFDMMKSIKLPELKCYEYQKETVWILPKNFALDFIRWGNHGSRNKRLPSWIYTLSQRQAKILLHAMILGDGTYHKSRTIYYTSSRQLALDTCSLAYMAGYVANVLGGETGYKSTTNFTENLYMWQIQITNRIENSPTEMYFDIKSHNRNGSFNPIDNTEHVVCFTVPNNTLITMYKGKTAVQGNCKQLHHLLRMDEFQERYINGEKYADCLIPNDLEHLLAVKQNIYDLDTARKIANETAERVIERTEKFYHKSENKEDEEILLFFEDFLYRIMKFSIAKEFENEQN